MIPVGILADGLVIPWSPAEISGLYSWHDASDFATIHTTEDGRVLQWDDKAGETHVTHATAGPMSGTRTLNGLNVLAYAGTGVLSAPIALQQPLTTFVAATLDEFTGGATVALGTQQYTAGFYLGRYASASQANVWYYSNSEVNLGDAFAPGPRLFTTHSDRSVLTFRLDGGRKSGQDTTINADLVTSRLTMGNLLLRTTSSMYGGLAEVLIFDRALDQAEIETVEAYLMQKWGI